MGHENQRAQSPEGQDCRCQGRRQPREVAPQAPLRTPFHRSALLALPSRPTIQTAGSALRRCRRCPRHTEFVSRRDLRYLLRQARFGHNLANALDEGRGAERLLLQDHLNSGIQPRMILDRKVERSHDDDRDLVPDRIAFASLPRAEIRPSLASSDRE